MIHFELSEESRYDRQQLISWWDQKKLAEAQVIVAGAGALGNEVLKLLALTGVGRITLIDFDLIAPSNLARMVLFRESDIGRSKVAVAVERLAEINPEVQARGIQGDLRFDLGLGDYRQADIVFGCLDSVNARWALNRKCMQAGVDWIDGGISDYHGSVAHYSPKSGACYECNFTQATFARFNRRYSCPFGFANSQAEEKVPTTAITTSVIAAIQVQQALLWLHGQREESLQPGERLLVYLKPFRMIKDRLASNPACLAHDPLPVEIPLWRAGNGSSTGQAILAAQDRYPAVQALALPFDLVVGFHCPACGQDQAVLRPKEKVFQEEARCPQCGGWRDPEIISQIGPAHPLAAWPLQALGIPPGEILAFQTPGELVYLQLGD